MKQDIAIEFRKITKTFLDGKIVANKDVSFGVKQGTIHAIAGENGAGKSTLMSMLFGLYKPTSGSIYVNGEEINYNSAKDAMDAGIGMVHQHFQLIEKFTVAQNVALGREMTKYGFMVYKDLVKKIDELCAKYNFNIRAKDKVANLSVGQEQKVEILKLLYTDSQILIFDEPTAMLTPEEIEEFIDIVLNLKKQGKTIIIITHKLDEIKKTADEVTVLRKGEYVGTKLVSEITPQVLSKMMVGHVVEQPQLPASKLGEDILLVENLSVKQRGIFKLKNVSLSIKAGEIVAIAGVEGNGQKELAEAISGLNKKMVGQIWMLFDEQKILKNYDRPIKAIVKLEKRLETLTKKWEAILTRLQLLAQVQDHAKLKTFFSKNWVFLQQFFIVCRMGVTKYRIKSLKHKYPIPGQPFNISNRSIHFRSLHGINHIPENRHKYGMILDMTVAENMMIRKYRERPYSYFGLLNNNKMKNDAIIQLEKFDVRGTHKGDALARGLSGGNQQKAVVARELSDSNSKLIIVFQATRGLDVGAIEFIHKQIIDARKQQKAILLISYDINEIMTLADRVLVMNSGRFTGELTREQLTKEKIGQLMSAKGE